VRTALLNKVRISGLIIGSLIFINGLGLAQTYYVQSGDSLYSIAARYGTTIAALQKSNTLTSNTIYPGQALQIFATTASSSSGYTVQAGDTLYLIARRYGTTVAALKSANNLSGDCLLIGRILRIPVSGSTTATHLVISGESLYLIAQKYGITVDALKEANQLSQDEILVGQELTIPQATKDSSSSSSYYLSESEIDLLARLVSAEASGESYTGQIAVAATILNRLNDSRYPDTVTAIIYQVDNGYYQYSPVLDGRINLSATASATNAVESALTGWDPSNGANGFYNPSKTTNTWVRSQTVTAVIGNHIFYKY